MDETDYAEPIAEIGFRSVQYGWRIGNNESGDAQYDDTQGIHPMVDTYGKFPYVYFSKTFFTTFHSNTI